MTEKRKASPPLSKLPSLSPKQLADYWGCTEQEVLDCIFTGTLRAHVFVSGMDLTSRRDEKEPSVGSLRGHYELTVESATRLLGGPTSENYTDCGVSLTDPPGIHVLHDVNGIKLRREHVRILREEIDRYDAAQGLDDGSPGPQNRASNRHRERCRAIAALVWEREPDLTIEALHGRDEITRIALEGVRYTRKTVREWVKDLCPNRRPGRRPKNSRGERGGSFP